MTVHIVSSVGDVLSDLEMSRLFISQSHHPVPTFTERYMAVFDLDYSVTVKNQCNHN